MARHPGRYYKNISLFIKLAIVALALGFIYKQVFYRPDRAELSRQFDLLFTDPPLVLLTLSVLLMFVNWGIEAWKWKMLVSRSENISLWHSLKAVLSGVTIGAFTPNRFGEFAGRIFYLQKTDRIDGILMTFAGSAAQLLVTIMMGCFGLLYIAFIDNPLPQRETSILAGAAISVCVLTAMLLLIYFNISLLAVRLSNVRWLKKYSSHVLLLGKYEKKELLNVFLLSLARFFVFSLQFYFLLIASGVNIGLDDALVAISLNYLVVAVIPTIALAELGVRGSAALACIGIYSDNELGIIAASFTLWIINIALPAIAGAFFVFGLKFYREKS